MMLSRVEISDFALIEKASLYPGPGLTVISGETGAGKSILIDAIGALIGERASRDLVRTGADKALLEAVFLDPERADDPDGQIFLERVIYATGGSECRHNGHLVKLADLRSHGEELVSIHGQHDNQIIFREREHLALLDAYVGAEIAYLLEKYEDLREQWQQTVRELEKLGTDPRERNRQLEMLKYQFSEIDAANIQPGEEDNLKRKAQILSARERILHDLEEVHHILGQDEEHTVGTLLQKSLEILEFSSRHSRKISSLRADMLRLSAGLDDIKTELEDFTRRLDVDADELTLVQERLDLINNLKRKYGPEEADILNFAANAATEIKRLERSAEDFSRLRDKLTELTSELTTAAAAIHQQRKKAAQQLDAGIRRELSDLEMPNVRFETIVEAYPPHEDRYGRWPRNGLDNVSFMIAPNPGEPLKPLARIASGGEASRVLLAIKAVLASVDKIPVLIFDEIDAGISGKTTDSIALKLRTIAKSCQVLCVTHSAQIAARAQTHYLIKKTVQAGRASTGLELLQGERRIDEISRLLSGQPEDPVSRELAVKMLTR